MSTEGLLRLSAAAARASVLAAEASVFASEAGFSVAAKAAADALEDLPTARRRSAQSRELDEFVAELLADTHTYNT